jgi:hypothetical protein
MGLRMSNPFLEFASGCALSELAVRDLREWGFVIIPGPVPPDGVARLAEAYDAAVAAAAPDDVATGSTTTRVHDFVTRGPAFDGLYIHPPVLDACARTIGRPFKLSALLGRTVRPGAAAQALHVDFAADADGWPMVGFILMVDEFRPDNGATGFVPGSHRWPSLPGYATCDRVADYEGQVLASGPAGAVIVYNGSVWHGHTANRSGKPRRSLQGAYIRRDAQSGFNLRDRLRPETLARLGPVARYLLDV